MHVPVHMLGQAGMRLELAGQTLYVDPYLSNSVQILDSPDLERLTPSPVSPQEVCDADWVLLTHDHIDHCDPHTLPKIAQASPQAQFVGPWPVLRKLESWGISSNRLHLASAQGVLLTPGLTVRSTPAAHPAIQRCDDGSYTEVGYLLSFSETQIYIAGDTALCEELIDYLRAQGPIHTAFLPVNEHNFFKGRRNIIGNMSVREAFGLAEELGIEQVVATHWDMFAVNQVFPEEIRLVHHKMACPFNLLLNPTSIYLGRPKASVIIRTLNEAKYLAELLQGIQRQVTHGLDCEVVLVDSGSTDGTLEIAEKYGCRILHISREQFSFGRSLNVGCEAAEGDILVITSGHCVPYDEYWLQRLCQPILDGLVQYTYGRQHGGPTSHFSECQVFTKYFPAQSSVPQVGIYCNNANSALLKSAWKQYRFDPELTGLEDMALAQQLVRHGGKVGYVAEAGVYHHHEESWPQVRRRFEREAIALQQIMPQVHVGVFDTLRYIVSSVWKDWAAAAQQGVFRKRAIEILLFRFYQYTGSYKGNHQHRRLSREEKDKYFYPV